MITIRKATVADSDKIWAIIKEVIAKGDKKQDDLDCPNLCTKHKTSPHIGQY